MRGWSIMFLYVYRRTTSTNDDDDDDDDDGDRGLSPLPDSTQLNTTGSWVELSQVVRVSQLPDAAWTLNSYDPIRLDSTGIRQFFLPVGQFWTTNSELVELSRIGQWRHEKLKQSVVIQFSATGQ